MNQQLSKDHLGLYANLMSTVGDFKAGLKADIKGMDAQYQMLGQRNADMRDQLIKMKEREKALMQKKAGIQGSIGEAQNANDNLQHVIKKLTQRISKLDQFENDVRGLMRDAENVKGCASMPLHRSAQPSRAPPTDNGSEPDVKPEDSAIPVEFRHLDLGTTSEIWAKLEGVRIRPESGLVRSTHI